MNTLLTGSHDSFLGFFNLLKNKEFAVSYFGNFSPEIKNAILADVRRKLDLLENKTMLRKRIYSVADESFTNIIHYARCTAQENYQSLFSIFRENNSYILTIGNQIEENHIDALKTRLELVSRLSAEELTREYQQVLNLPLDEDAQGAGLGIIIMALRSGNKLDHIIEKLNNGSYFFILRIKIS